MNKRIIAVLMLLTVFFAGCAQEKDYVVTIKTQYGDMVAILYDETPKHKQNFIKLAQQHFFDSLLFHRVIEGFMIQGGDPDSKKAQPGQMLGRGGPGYTVDAEIVPAFFHEKGSLSAARMGNETNPSKASSGSQFYIVQGKKSTEDEVRTDPVKFNQALQQFFQDPANRPVYDSIGQLFQTGNTQAAEQYILKLKPRVEKATGLKTDREVAPEKLKAYTTVGGAPQLDGEYTVFGKIIKGLDVVDKIAALPKDQSDRPQNDVRMTVTVEQVSKKKIEKLYGYHFPPKPKAKPAK